jgi:hypothetical protein
MRVVIGVQDWTFELYLYVPGRARKCAGDAAGRAAARVRIL